MKFPLCALDWKNSLLQYFCSKARVTCFMASSATSSVLISFRNTKSYSLGIGVQKSLYKPCSADAMHGTCGCLSATSSELGFPGHFGLHIFALSYLLYHVLVALNFTLSFKAVVVCCLLLYFMEDVRLTRARRLNMVCSSSRGCSAYRVNLFAYPRIGVL